MPSNSLRIMLAAERQRHEQQQTQQQPQPHHDQASGLSAVQPGAYDEFEVEKAFFSGAPVGVHCVDSNGVILWANHAELNFLGYSNSDYVGRCITSFVYSENKADWGQQKEHHHHHHPGLITAGVGADQQSGGAHANYLMTVDDRTLYNEVLKQVTAGNAISEIPVRFVTGSGTIAYLLLDCDGRASLRRNFDISSSSLTDESATAASSTSSNSSSSATHRYFRFFTRDDTARRIHEMRLNVLFQEKNQSLQMLEDFMNRSMQQMRAPLTLMERACDLVAENIKDVDEIVRGLTISSINATSNSTSEQEPVQEGKSYPETSLSITVEGTESKNCTSKRNMLADNIKTKAVGNVSSANDINFAVPLAVALSATSEARSVVNLATTLTKDALALVDDITDLCRFDQGRVLLIEKEAVKVQELCLEAMSSISSCNGSIAGGVVDVVLDVQEGTPARAVCDRSVLKRSLALLLNFAVHAASNAAAASVIGTTTRGKVILSVQDAAGWGGTGDVPACKISVFYSNPMESPNGLGAAVTAARQTSPMVFLGSNTERHPLSTNDIVLGLTSGSCGSIDQKTSSRPRNMDATEVLQSYQTTFHLGPMTNRIRQRESIQSGMTSCRQEKLGLGLSLLYHLVGAQGSDLRYDIVTEQQGPSSFGLSSMTKFWFLLPMSLDFPDRLPAWQYVKGDIQDINTQVSGGFHLSHLKSPCMTSFVGSPDDDIGIQQSRQKRAKISYPHVPMNPLKSLSLNVNPTKIDISSNVNHPESYMISENVAAASTSQNDATAAAAGGALMTKQYPGVIPGLRPLVLVVEDTDVSASLLCMHLRKLNCTSHRAENGEVAIEMLRSAPAPNMYSLILMDLRMPVMDGFEATKIIKSSIASSIPVVALTGETSEENRKRCEEIGFDAYQTKPLKRPELKELLIKYVPGYTPFD